MTGTAVGQMAAAGRSTTTTMFTCPILRSHHAATATIQQDLRLRTVRVESAGQVEWVGQVESAGRAESAGQAESAGRVEWVAQGVSADPGVSVDQGELAGQAELAGVLNLALSAERVHLDRQDHLLGHTTQPRRGSTGQIIRT
jgi:hypothetical protein